MTANAASASHAKGDSVGQKILETAMNGVSNVFSGLASEVKRSKTADETPSKRSTPEGTTGTGGTEDIIQRALFAYGQVFAQELNSQSARIDQLQLTHADDTNGLRKEMEGTQMLTRDIMAATTAHANAHDIRMNNVETAATTSDEKIAALIKSVDEIKAQMTNASTAASRAAGAQQVPARPPGVWSSASSMSSSVNEPFMQPRDPCRVVLFNMGENVDDLKSIEDRAYDCLDQIGVEKSQIRTLSAFKNKRKINMVNVLFASVNDVSYVEIALARKRFNFVLDKDKVVWLKVADPPPPVPLRVMYHRTVDEVQALESDTFGTDAKPVRSSPDTHQVFVDEIQMCSVSRNGVQWTDAGRTRYEAPARQFISRRVVN